MLSLQFGVSIFGVVITVAAFMLGLGGGSLLGTKVLQRISHPLRLFAIVEFVIALISLGIPFMFQWIEVWQSDLTMQSSIGVWYLWQFLFTGIVLLLPALLMGLGFPLILSVFEAVPSSLGIVYAVNTLGAALGALLPLLLLPLLGWTFSLYTIVGISILIAVFSGVVSYKISTLSPPHLDTEKQQLRADQVPMLVAYAGIGAAALMLEIGWTRLFGMMFLRTEYVLAIILAVFLVGIATGSYMARYLKKEAWFNSLPIVAGVFVIVSLWLFPKVSNIADFQQLTSLNQALVYQGFLIAALTIPVTLVFGAWLPLLNQRLGDSGISGARLYGANSIGAALGALVAGFILTPAIGTNATIIISAILIVLFSLAWAKNYKLVVVAPLIAILAIPLYTMSPVYELMPRLYANTIDLFQHEDALSITHVIAKQDGQRLLLADLQRMDASSDPASVESQRNQARLPLLLHPNPNSVLFLGLGTGISASSSLNCNSLLTTCRAMTPRSCSLRSLSIP